MNTSIRNKLLLLGGLGTSLVIGLGYALKNAVGTSDLAVAALARANSAIRNQMEGDMCHDALRGDAYWACLARDEVDLQAASDSLEEHGKSFVDFVHGNTDVEMPEVVRKDAEKLGPEIVAYVQAGRAVVALARSDRKAAAEMLPEFEKAFQKLETLLSGVSDRIQTAAASMQKDAATSLASAGDFGLWCFAVAVLAMVGGSWLLSRSILGPLAELRRRVDMMGAGDCDLRQRIVVTHQDELGAVANGFNVFLSRLQSMVSSLGNNTTALLDASRSLLSTSNDLATGAEQTRGQSAQVATAAEEMSATLQEVSNNGQQTKERIATVAEAVSQIGLNVAEVARSAEQANAVTGEAAELANSSNTLIVELGAAAEEIGRVINTIQDIADQTNLLALNATIEAARAGEAGRGFAVVANEVKALAAQTSEATTDIRQRIERIQGGTQQTVGRVGQIVKVIARVSESSQAIANQVGEQRAAMQSITDNVGEVARMMNMLSTGVHESAKVSTEISRSITEVDHVALRSTEGAHATRDAGRQVENLAGQLQSLLGQFKA